jgi:hypothetical protein
VYPDTDARQHQGLAGVIQTAAKHMDDRAPYRQLFVDLLAYSKLNHEEKSLRTRSYYEVRALVGCSEASRTEAIEGIIMQGFFRLERDNVRRRRRLASTWSATQPRDDAVGKVFGTPELLEGILTHLPELDLITSTRVNKTFRHLIHQSPTLLRTLFLLPPKGFSETITRGDLNIEALADRSGHNTGYQMVTLCPLLSPLGSHLTMNERFEFYEHELVHIKQSAAWADPFSHMYLTSPPCIEVDVELMYVHVGTESGEGYPTGERNAKTAHMYSAIRKIRKRTGVTFAALMEAVYAKGDVKIAIKERILIESTEGELDEDWAFCNHSHVKKRTTLYHEVKAWEQKHSVAMFFSGATVIELHGVRLWTYEDKAEAARKEKELELQNEQRENFQRVLTELRMRDTIVLKQDCDIAAED